MEDHFELDDNEEDERVFKANEHAKFKITNNNKQSFDDPYNQDDEPKKTKILIPSFKK